MTAQLPLSDLNDRSREVFRQLVEAYIDTGEPVGSRTLSRTLTEGISAATVRNVMQDLEHLGLLDSPHTSAGRMPTDLGLRLFVDGFMEVADVSGADRNEIMRSLGTNDEDIARALDRAGTALSGLTQSASVVMTPIREAAAVKHVEFVPLSAEQVLVILVADDGQVENRLIRPPLGMTPSSMRQAGNFLNTVLEGRSLDDMRRIVDKELERHRSELDVLTQDLIETGVAQWSGDAGDPDRLIVRGRANLITDGASEDDIDRVRQLFDDLERKEGLVQLLNLADDAEGVRIFIGSENKLFSLSGSSLVISPYMNADRRIVGAVGVIGPTRLNYGRVVSIVDYTAQLVGKLVSDRQGVQENG